MNEVGAKLKGHLGRLFEMNFAKKITTEK